MNTFQDISTNTLHGVIENKAYIIVDVRPTDDYNGWRMKGEVRGGHIKGARSLPVKWTSYIDWIEIVRAKEILPDKNIVIYGRSRDEAYLVATRFRKSGYRDIYLYNSFSDEWIADDRFPMERLARYRQLVSPGWLHRLIKGETPPEFEGEKFVLCHAHYRNREDYDIGHIPGAIEVDTNSLESPETWNRRSPEELEEALRMLGITRDTTVILYGRFSNPVNNDPFPGSSAGHLGSIRLAFIMMYAGVKDVRILNGGLQSWLDEGYATTTYQTIAVPVDTTGLDIPERPWLAVDLPEARSMLASDNANLVCVRSLAEYRGEVSGYNYIKKKGRIPGALFGDCGTDAYHMENYRNLDHTCKEYHEIEAAWHKAGIVPEKHNAFYCGTGWRGSEAWLNAYLMGWPEVSVFDGGWFEWSNNPENPFETGKP